jgi:hypothetical protein
VKIEVHNTCSDFDSYRAARVKSLFNAETGANFDLTAELPIDDEDLILMMVGRMTSRLLTPYRQMEISTK